MKVLLLVSTLLISTTAMSDSYWSYYNDYADTEEENYQAQINLLRSQNDSSKKRAASTKLAAEKAHAKFTKEHLAKIKLIRGHEKELASAQQKQGILRSEYLELEEAVGSAQAKYTVTSEEKGMGFFGLGAAKETKQAKKNLKAAKAASKIIAKKFSQNNSDIDSLRGRVSSAKTGLSNLQSGGGYDDAYGQGQDSIESDLTRAQKNYNGIVKKMAADGKQANTLEAGFAAERARIAQNAAKDVFNSAGRNVLKASLILTDLDYLKAQQDFSEEKLKYLQSEAANRLKNTMLGQYINDRIAMMESKVQSNLCEEAQACLKGENVFGQRLIEFIEGKNSGNAGSGKGSRTKKKN